MATNPLASDVCSVVSQLTSSSQQLVLKHLLRNLNGIESSTLENLKAGLCVSAALLFQAQMVT
jgi:hypothetical protein